jgi:hypothetical protein
LTETNPPVLAKVPINLTSQEAGRIMARALTVGEDEFKQANGLIGSGKTDEAISAFERLRKEYPATWIDRRSAGTARQTETCFPEEPPHPVPLPRWGRGTIDGWPCFDASRRCWHRE